MTKGGEGQGAGPAYGFETDEHGDAENKEPENKGDERDEDEEVVEDDDSELDARPLADNPIVILFLLMFGGLLAIILLAFLALRGA
ncbi:MAG: hypothetical protein ACYDDF_03300 [Thermoplasmatota archaeon]